MCKLGAGERKKQNLSLSATFSDKNNNGKGWNAINKHKAIQLLKIWGISTSRELPGHDSNPGNSVFILEASIFIFLLYSQYFCKKMKCLEKNGSLSINAHHTIGSPQLSLLWPCLSSHSEPISQYGHIIHPELSEHTSSQNGRKGTTPWHFWILDVLASAIRLSSSDSLIFPSSSSSGQLRRWKTNKGG